MRLATKTFIFCSFFLQFCKAKPINDCSVSIEAGAVPFEHRLLLTADSDTIKECRDIGKDTVAGGYYTFKNGLLQSYYFLLASDTTYIPKDGDDVLEEDRTTNKITFCSYAETFDDKGEFSNSVDIPLVYRYVNLIGQDSICVTAKFFSLNKEYKDIQVNTNSNYSSPLRLTEDTLFTNMKQGCFQFSFGQREDIRIYISGSYVQKCSNELKSFADTILLKYANGELSSS